MRNETPALLADLYRRHIGSQDVCLDLGCGDGGTSGTYISRHAASYSGVDVSKKAVELARANGYDAWAIPDASRLPFADASFDVVVCVEVLEHLFEPQRAVAEARRVLKPGGRLLVTVPNAMYWRNRADMLLGLWHPAGDDLGRQQPWRSPHIRFFSLRSLAQMLEKEDYAVTVGGFPAPLLLRVPGLRQFAGTPRMPARVAARVWPSLLADPLWAVATR